MDNLLKKLRDAFSGVFKSRGGDQSIVGIDIGTSSIKAVQVRMKNGRAILETYGSIALGPYDNKEPGMVTNLPTEKIIQAIGDVLRESGITASNAAISITSTASLIFIVELPASVSEKEFPTAVPIEARKQIPVPISEVSLDWWAIPKRQDAFEDPAIQEEGEHAAERQNTQVLIVSILNDAIERYKIIGSGIGKTLAPFESEVFSSVRANSNRELGAVMVLDVGASKTKVTIVEYGVVKGFHIINRGSHDISASIATSLNVSFAKAEEIKKEFGLVGNAPDASVSDIIRLSLDFIFSEAKTAMLEYERTNKKLVTKIILSGGGVLLKGFHEASKKHFSSEIVFGEPFAKTDSPAFLANILKTIGPEFSIAIGVALRDLR